MKKIGVSVPVVLLVVLTISSSALYGKTLEVETLKDSFFRTGDNNRNNGANPQLLLVDMPISRSVISFDLSAVTNEIQSAEFHFVQANTIRERDALSFIIAPMVQTANNSAWGEGGGNLGIKGHLAQEGEASALYSSTRSVQWESASGKAVFSLFDDQVWGRPVVTMDDVVWKEGNVVSIAVGASLLEKVRKSEEKILTLGLWGISGKGLYHIRSKESGAGPKLMLQLKDEAVEE